MVALVALFALCVVPSVRLAPQRGIDFLLGDEEQQAVVKPIPGDPGLTEQQPQRVPGGEDEQFNLLQDRSENEVQATVDPVENEQQTEDPTESGLTLDSVADEGQFTEEPVEHPADEVTDAPKDTVPQTTVTPVDASSTVTSDAPSAVPKDATPSSEPSTTTADSVEDVSSEEQLTTNPIVVEESNHQPSTTESNEDSNQFAEDVNSLVDSPPSQVRFGESEDSRLDGQPQSRPQPQPQPKQNVPEYSTALPPAPPAVPVGEGYDSKSVESGEDDDDDDEQVQLKVDPNDQQSMSGPTLNDEQYRALLKQPWFSQARFTGYPDQWAGFPQRSSWQQRDDQRQRLYQTHVSDGFHGHGFHRSSWH